MRCRISILTEIDGERSVVVRKGELALNGDTIELSYLSGDNSGKFVANETVASWESVGEMSVRLVFDTRAETTGMFSTDALSGDVRVKTNSIVLENKTDVVSVEIAYTLVFDYGEADMRVKVMARLIDETDVFVS